MSIYITESKIRFKAPQPGQQTRPIAEHYNGRRVLAVVNAMVILIIHTGTMTRRSKALNEHRPDAYVEINYVDAKRLGIEEKSRVRVTSRRGEVETYAMVGDIKMDIHTDANNQYIPINGNIIEFIVDTNKLDPKIKKLGDVSNSGLEGKIVMIEEVIAYGK